LDLEEPYNAVFHHLYLSPNIILVITLRTIRWTSQDSWICDRRMCAYNVV